MADRVLFISWTGVVTGREERALEAFNENVGLLGRMQQEGRIESFDITLMSPNAGIDGFMQVHGTMQQISALREDAEFQRATANAQLCVEGITHVDGVTNDAIAEQMGLYQEAISRVPQMA
ncbi:MAG: hypothetical protein JHC95_21470 [Solirubrobacteraceae bacterium]|nr:hypothetical protein [Solirubrobacteraceae bacterium]